MTNVGSALLDQCRHLRAEERDQAKTISRPTIVTQNNVQGMVQQGVQVPIQTIDQQHHFRTVRECHLAADGYAASHG